MPKFRKLPVVIEAVQVSDREPCPDWLGKAFSDETARPDRDTGAVLIDTLEGTMRADPGDWIIKGVNGEIYHFDRLEDAAAAYQKAAAEHHKEFARF